MTVSLSEKKKKKPTVSESVRNPTIVGADGIFADVRRRYNPRTLRMSGEKGRKTKGESSNNGPADNRVKNKKLTGRVKKHCRYTVDVCVTMCSLLLLHLYIPGE